MVGDAHRIFPYIAIGQLIVAGFVLLVASPMLLVLGGWGGADSGSIVRGIGAVFGLPWLVYFVCAAAAASLLHYDRSAFACLPAVIPVALEMWLIAAWLSRQGI
jgi:hypothetical protein